MTTTLTAPPSGTRSRRPDRRATLAARENRAGIAFVSPTLLVVTAVVVVPIACTVVLAFQRTRLVDIQTTGLMGAWTLRNFEQVFLSPGFWTSLWTTVVYTAGTTIGSIALGLVAALALRRPFKGRAVLRGSMMLPYVAPVVSMAFVWEVMLSPEYGIVNAWGVRLLNWDAPIGFLTQRSLDVEVLGLTVPVPIALVTVIVFESWRYFPFTFLFLLARLQAVPRGLEEAAMVDGATPLQRFRHIVLPQLMPVMALLTVLRVIMTFNKFDDVYLLTGGGAGTEVVAVRVYNFLTARFDVGAASAQALVLAAVLAALLGVYFRFFASKVQEEKQ
ncbi:sugar ABC transporter permease [Streptomonospora sp. PA3]|uniref:carbohydrate ABC transporter permease n=1 Tax=Streptomonospora sp. PA3 TaxID=2607326 RepID=UPI0012DECA9A|nr:sugar ABC transporter permease [Streptomonospora sp. PA3]MUL41789.1 sugar ABC transporter permease [Streptomonospora sp. PA3]